MGMSLIFVVIAIVLFILASWGQVQNASPVHLGWLGLAFWAASTIVG